MPRVRRSGQPKRNREAAAGAHLWRLQDVEVRKGAFARRKQVGDVGDVKGVGVVEVAAQAVEEDLQPRQQAAQVSKADQTVGHGAGTLPVTSTSLGRSFV